MSHKPVMMVDKAATGLARRMARHLFRNHVENGLSVSLRLAAVALAAGLLGGQYAAAFIAIGALCVSIVDQPGPLPAKRRALFGALLGGSLVSLLAGLAAGQPLAMASVVVLTSLALALATAFGRPALMLGITGVLALIIGMAIPAANKTAAIGHTLLFLAGGTGYAMLATVAAACFDDRNRRMFLNEALLSFATYLRARSRLYDPQTPPEMALTTVIEVHATLMERLQAARNTIFTGETTIQRRKWIGGMLALLDLYEVVLSSDADWEALREAPRGEVLQHFGVLTQAMAADVDAVALALVSSAPDSPSCDHAQEIEALDATLERLALDAPKDAAGLVPTRNKLARALQRSRQLAEILMPGAAATEDLPGVALSAFVQPPYSWWETLRPHLSTTSPVMRYAIRLTLAMLAGYAVTVAFPAYVHGGWILLTIALIMRASYAVTVQRRNDRIIGTLAGCAVAAVLIPVLPSEAVVGLVIAGAGLAHAYGAVNYKITSFAASLMALMLLHFLEPQSFFVTDRIIDTLVGAGLAAGFARVLPSWEWRDVPGLIGKLMAADCALAGEALQAAPHEQNYRLTRKHALDSFAMLATTTRRLASEPHKRIQQFASLNELLAANYLFASDLTSVHGMLLEWADEIDADEASELLRGTRERVLERLAEAASVPLPEHLRRRGWFELHATKPMMLLRRRLRHIEHSAWRLAAQAVRAARSF